jgi:UDP-2,3-diacylglucosamine pyrophosphatase LpxH
LKKNIYIGDIHGRSVWEEIVKEHKDADNIVFIGDYFDSLDIPSIVQLKNVENILEFKKKQELDPSKKVYLLIGNHDIHYIPGLNNDSKTSGFQKNMLMSFGDFFHKNLKYFQMSILLGKNLCTHAGVSSIFLDEVGYWKFDENKDFSNVSDFLNDLFHYKPKSFLFDSHLDRGHISLVNSYGDDVFQTPIWIRPRSLQKSNKKSELKKNYIQIVGHTGIEKIDIKGKSTGGRYYYIDALEYGQYLIEENGGFKIGYCNIESEKQL